MPRHSLILFDLDGTLTDPLEGIGRSLNYALEHFGYAPVAPEAMGTYIGPPLDHSFRAITGSSSAAHIEALVVKYRERYADVGYAENVVYAGIPEALAALHERGIPLAVCTSKRADFAARILDLFGLRQFFQFVSGGETGIEKWQQLGKLREGGQVPADAVMVGDRKFDIQAGQRNGLAAAGVLWGYGSLEELSADKPLYLFRTPADLPVGLG
jgi:phosphoglycolate phosphatase